MVFHDHHGRYVGMSLVASGKIDTELAQEQWQSPEDAVVFLKNRSTWWSPPDAEPEQWGKEEGENLKKMVDAVEADVVVMTQACDLEQGKVSNVVLCPHLSLSEFRELWEAEKRRSDQNPTPRAWGSYCKGICDGYVWTLAILNAGSGVSLTTEHRIVDFREIYTVPRDFLETLLSERQQPRLRLLPPYREHLSQAFARFFMRVGLPVGVTPACCL